MFKWQSQRGTTSLAEYAVTIFLVIATITAMTTYVQRTLQARLRDARHYMVKTVSTQCDDVYCGPAANLAKQATSVGGLTAGLQRIGDQYEPYYAQVDSNIERDQERNKKLTTSGDAAGIFMDQGNTASTAGTLSNQLSPSFSRTQDDQALVSSRD